MRFAVFLFVVYVLVLFKLLFFKATVNFSDIAITGNTGVSFQRLLAESNFVPFRRIVYYLRGEEPYLVGALNLAGNVVLFVPMGFFLPYFFPQLRSAARLVAVVALASLSIEAAQLFTTTGQFDVDDVLLNTAGAALGRAGYVRWKTPAQPRQQE